MILRQNHTFIQENRATTKIVFFRRKKSKKYSYFFYGASYAKSDFVFGLAMLFWVRIILHFKKNGRILKLYFFPENVKKIALKAKKPLFCVDSEYAKMDMLFSFFFSTRWWKNHFCCNLFRVKPPFACTSWDLERCIKWKL